MNRDEILRRPAIKQYKSKLMTIDIKGIDDEYVYYTAPSWQGPRPHRAKLRDVDSDPWFQAEEHRKIFLRNCEEV